MGMANKWERVVRKQYETTYKFPEGWSTVEEVALQLSCPVEEVDSVLAPCIKARTVQRKVFTVYDKSTGKLSRVQGYTIEEGATETPVGPARITPQVGDRVKRRRSGALGTVQHDGSVKWDMGRITRPTTGWDRGEIQILPSG